MQLVPENVACTLVALNTAIRNIRLYPPTSSIIIQSLEKTHIYLTAVFNDAKTLCLAQSEKQLLINGTALGAKDRNKTHFQGFLGLPIG